MMRKWSYVDRIQRSTSSRSEKSSRPVPITYTSIRLGKDQEGFFRFYERHVLPEFGVNARRPA